VPVVADASLCPAPRMHASLCRRTLLSATCHVPEPSHLSLRELGYKRPPFPLHFDRAIVPLSTPVSHPRTIALFCHRCSAGRAPQHSSPPTCRSQRSLKQQICFPSHWSHLPNTGAPPRYRCSGEPLPVATPPLWTTPKPMSLSCRCAVVQGPSL
jgi:hypothetical protein